MTTLGMCYSVSQYLHLVMDFVTAYINYRIKEGELGRWRSPAGLRYHRLLCQQIFPGCH